MHLVRYRKMADLVKRGDLVSAVRRERDALTDKKIRIDRLAGSHCRNQCSTFSSAITVSPVSRRSPDHPETGLVVEGK
jgi:hypothetical protein